MSTWTELNWWADRVTCSHMPSGTCQIRAFIQTISVLLIGLNATVPASSVLMLMLLLLANGRSARDALYLLHLHGSSHHFSRCDSDRSSHAHRGYIPLTRGFWDFCKLWCGKQCQS